MYEYAFFIILWTLPQFKLLIAPSVRDRAALRVFVSLSHPFLRVDRVSLKETGKVEVDQKQRERTRGFPFHRKSITRRSLRLPLDELLV